MDRAAVRTLLRAFPSARTLEPKDQRDLLAVLRPVRVPAGQALFRAGDGSGPAYLILSGLVRVERRLESGRVVLLGRLGPGEFLGDMSLIDGGARSASALVEIDTEAMMLDVESWRRMRDEAHPVAMWLMMEVDRNVAGRVRGMYDRLCRLRAEPGLAAEPVGAPPPRRPWYQAWRRLTEDR